MGCQAKHILIVGQKGSGKSSLLNALLNNDVARASLKRPAPVSSGTERVTIQLTDYYDPNLSLGITDTGHVNELSVKLAVSGAGYTHIILCVPEAGISRETLQILKVLSIVFGPDLIGNLILYVHGDNCDESIDDFYWHNQWGPWGPLMSKLTGSRVIRDRIVVGTLRSHADPQLDREQFMQDRIALLQNMKKRVNLNLAPIYPCTELPAMNLGPTYPCNCLFRFFTFATLCPLCILNLQLTSDG